MEGRIFNGTESYTEASAWLIDCKRITREVGRENALRRRIVAWQSKGEALEWWTLVRGENIKEEIA